MVSAKNPMAQRSHVTLEEVASSPLIFPKTGFTRQVLDKLFRPYRSRLRIAMELPSIGMIKTFVAADVGISIISESFARDQVKSGEVKLLNVEGFDLYPRTGAGLPAGSQPATRGAGTDRDDSRNSQARRRIGLTRISHKVQFIPRVSSEKSCHPEQNEGSAFRKRPGHIPRPVQKTEWDSE